ncbi:unnamed protein product [Rhizopus stolonifer]
MERASVDDYRNVHQLIKCLHHSKQQRGDYIRAVRLGYDITISDDELLSLLPLIPNLEVFAIKQAEQLTDKSLIPISNYCRQLKHFSVSGALCSYRTAHYLGQCIQLQQLGFAACPNLTAMALLPFVHRAIEQLDLSGCKWLTVNDTAQDLRSFVHLTHLNLICSDIISADFLHHLTELVHLQDFSITGNSVIDDQAIVPFIKNHSNLRGLLLLECAISDDTLQVIAEYLPELRHLDISFCTRVTLQAIRSLIHHCPYLEALGLKHCGLSRSDFPELTLKELSTLNCDDLDRIRKHKEDTIQDSYAYIHHYLSTEQVH